MFVIFQQTVTVWDNLSVFNSISIPNVIIHMKKWYLHPRMSDITDKSKQHKLIIPFEKERLQHIWKLWSCSEENWTNYQNVKVSLWYVFSSASSLQLPVLIMVCCILLWYNRSMPLWHPNTIWYWFIFRRCWQGYMLLSACCSPTLTDHTFHLASYSNGKSADAGPQSV